MTSKLKDFGLGKESLIIKSRVRNIFTPHTPIQTADFFFGRQLEVSKLIEHISTPGQHALLYGNRGVGKSSLANVASILLQQLMRGKLYKKRCDSTDTFVTILQEPLEECGFEINLKSIEKKHKQSGKASIKIPLAEGGIDSERETTMQYSSLLDNDLSPGWVAKKICDINALLVIDEVDSIKNSDDKIKLAELIKHLSDENSKFKILLVGIADTAAKLTAGHPSVSRCLRETRLARMRDEELREIIQKGATSLRLTFDYNATKSIVELSAGYPHFTHLLALKCAEEVISKSDNLVNMDVLQIALHSASEDAEETLKRKYDRAVRSSQTDMYKKIVGAATYCNQHEFKARELRDNLEKYYSTKISPKCLSSYIKKLVSDSQKTIFYRVSNGVYRFNDPRMPSYIRIIEKRVS